MQVCRVNTLSTELFQLISSDCNLFIGFQITDLLPGVSLRIKNQLSLNLQLVGHPVNITADNIYLISSGNEITAGHIYEVGR